MNTKPFEESVTSKATGGQAKLLKEMEIRKVTLLKMNKLKFVSIQAMKLNGVGKAKNHSIFLAALECQRSDSRLGYLPLEIPLHPMKRRLCGV
jgi:hypothetical protein